MEASGERKIVDFREWIVASRLVDLPNQVATTIQWFLDSTSELKNGGKFFLIELPIKRGLELYFRPLIVNPNDLAQMIWLRNVEEAIRRIPGWASREKVYHFFEYLTSPDE